MANRLSGKADFEIPASLIDCHEWMSDELIDGPTGQNCRLVYPVTNNAVCPNCIYDPRAQRSSGIYKAGGPIPFTNHTVCPWCGGIGRTNRAVEESIRLRVYWSTPNWRDTGGGGPRGVVEDPNNHCWVIGYMTDLPRLEKAERVLVDSDVAGVRRWLFERRGEASPWGFRQDRYFRQFLERTGGG